MKLDNTKKGQALPFENQRYHFSFILERQMRVCHKKENGHFFLKSKKKNGHGKWGVQRKAHFFDAHFFLIKKNPIQKNGCGGAIGDPFFSKMEVMLWIIIIKHQVLSNVNFIFNKRNERKAKSQREK